MAALDPTTNFICHIWNNTTRQRRYFREGGVHLDVFQTYVHDFVNDYVENCTDEATHYYISIIRNKDPELILKLYGNDDRDVRQVNANAELDRIREYLPAQKAPAVALNKSIRIKKP
jgi:succinate dehydrogenase flavin-adding protein (antitoxin of CptAB toxin-antitoxin module)